MCCGDPRPGYHCALVGNQRGSKPVFPVRVASWVSHGVAGALFILASMVIEVANLNKN